MTMNTEEKFVRVIATLIEVLKRQVKREDREQAIEKLNQAERLFLRYFLSSVITPDEIDRCPICAAAFKADDVCASDITEGTCHAACLEGSPVVDLETGKETGGKVDTYRYSEVMEPAPKDRTIGSETPILSQMTLENTEGQMPTGDEGLWHFWNEKARKLAEENAELRAGIKRLSDEEELCAETTGDDPFSMVYLAAKLAAVEHDLAGAKHVAKNALSDLQYWRSKYEELSGAPKNNMTSSLAVLDVIAERRRQVESEGWSPQHDDAHVDYSLAKAACVYAVGATLDGPDRAVMDSHGAAGTRAWMKESWPWDIGWWKPTDRRRDLVKAAALIIAEIERLDRAAATEGSDR